MKRTALHLFFLLSAIWLKAQSNQYLHFDMVDDYVEVPNASALIANSNQITMAGWFYHDALSYGQGLMSFRGGGSGTGEMYIIQLNNGTLECRLITTAGFHEFVAPQFTIVPQTWQHVAWVYDGSMVRLYINGTQIGSKNATGTITSTNRPFTVGKCVLGGFNFVFGGRADEVTLWNKALTAQEIQDMMANELNGDESGLQLYYKFNQGVPGGDNTSISQLVDDLGNIDGNLLNFGLTGATSNFGGTLDVSFQAITFPQIPTKLVSDLPFQLGATASSGLPVTYEILSGPATLNGNTVTLTGQVGTVTIKASQPGDAVYDPADDAVNSFEVVDPNTFVPSIDARNPLAGEVFMPNLGPLQLAAISDIGYPGLFSVTNLEFEVNGEVIPATDWGNKHYTAWWAPPAYGNYELKITATNNFGAAATKTVAINVVNQANGDESVAAFADVWADINHGQVEVDAELPCYVGAFNEIAASLAIDCPPGGCDPWDRISSIEVKGHNGKWYEIMRYITPYGVACAHVMDATDFMSLLQGKVTFRVNLGTLGNGFLYSLLLDYAEGQPAHPYSTVQEVWHETYDFGNPANLQPVPQVNIPISAGTKAAKLKLVSTGHGWGDNNTDNAAEFHEDTHHVWVNGQQTFEQHNWQTCNPNPDGCSPQNGTWYFARAGWCPGSIAPWFDYDMTAYATQSSVTMKYVFDEDYTDLCHANNPNCVSGVTCPDCNDGFNPHLIVACYLISTGDSPLGEGSTGTAEKFNTIDFSVFPNPASGLVNISFGSMANGVSLRLINGMGQAVLLQQLAGSTNSASLQIGHLPKGIYMLEVKTADGMGIQKLVVE